MCTTPCYHQHVTLRRTSVERPRLLSLPPVISSRARATIASRQAGVCTSKADLNTAYLSSLKPSKEHCGAVSSRWPPIFLSKSSWPWSPWSPPRPPPRPPTSPPLSQPFRLVFNQTLPGLSRCSLQKLQNRSLFKANYVKDNWNYCGPLYKWGLCREAWKSDVSGGDLCHAGSWNTRALSADLPGIDSRKVILSVLVYYFSHKM